MPDAPQACPACGREVDALRAGQVAILGGRFLYFCDRDCKAKYMQGVADSVARDDVATAEPPPVAPATSSDRLLVPADSDASPPAEVEAESPQEDLGPRSGPVRTWAVSVADTAEPPSMRPRVESVPAEGAPPSGEARGGAGVDAVTYAGIAAGALALGVALVGAPAATLRAPLALFACACQLVVTLLRRRDASEARAWAPVAPVVLAGVPVVWALAVHAKGTPQVASIAGLTAASVLAVDAVLARARETTAALRGRLLRAIDVPARDGQGRVRAADEVRAGEQVVVETDEVMPVDGVVVAGEATVSPWVDATLDVPRREGDPVVAGARVLSGHLRVAVTWTGGDRAAVKLLVSPASRVDVAAPVVHLARIAAERVVPLVGVLAGAAAFVNGGSWFASVATAAAAISAFGAPGVLGAVALTHGRGHLRALHAGIFYRDPAAFDRAGRAQIAVVCTRGTVLAGEPEVVAVESFAGGPAETGDAAAPPSGSLAQDSNDVLALAGALAMGGTHPFLAAVLHTARARSVTLESVRAAVHYGSGVSATDASGERAALGRRSFLLSEKVSVAVADATVREHEAQGRSVLLLARGGKLVGLLALQDAVRAGARPAIQRLHDARIEPVLLSGEARETCETIGRALDVEHLRPEVAVAERGAEVRALGEGGDVVAVLGHPAVDDAALGAADVSVALASAGGSPGEWSASLAGDDLRDAVSALTLPRAARERALRAMMMGLAPGLLFTLAVAFGLFPVVAAPVAGLIGALAAVTYSRGE